MELMNLKQKNDYTVELSDDEKRILAEDLMKCYRRTTNIAEMIMLKKVLHALGMIISDWVPCEDKEP